MYKMSPAAFHKLTPQQRMRTMLAGLGNSTRGVEVRGQNGALLSLVPESSPAKAMVKNVLMAPTVSTPGGNGRFQVVETKPQFGWKTGNLSHPPVLTRHTIESADYRNGRSAVQQVAGLGWLNGATMVGGGGTLATQTQQPQEVASQGASAPSSSTPLVTSRLTTRSPIMPTVRATPPPVQVVAPTSTPSAPQSGTPEYGTPEWYAAGGSSGQATPPPGAVPTVQLTPNPATALPATAAAPGLPLWQIGLGAAAVFGGIWFFTRK